MNNPALSLLGIHFFVIQAPIAGVSTPRLAAAVSISGGLGSIAVGAGTPAKAAEAIAEVRRLTGRPFNVNLFSHRPAQADPTREAQWLEYLAPHFTALGASPPAQLREIYKSFVDDDPMLEVLLSARPAVVSFHFGLPPSHYIKALKDAGIVLMACATTPDEAAQVEDAGIDLLIAQGAEAGGHRGVFDPVAGDAEIGTFALTRLIASRNRLPVIAAGGIMDGQSIAAAMKLGACAAQLGTAFILCPESAATPHHRALIKNAQASRTAITSAISGRPARGIVNRFFDQIGAPGHPSIPDYPNASDAAMALNAAATGKGGFDYSARWAGQGVALAREMPAAALMQALQDELAQ